MGSVDSLKFPRSAYIHIPFCHRRCFYCDFAVVPLGDKANGEVGPGSQSIKSYLDFLHREISIAPEGAPLSTVYIGGGTPSLLTPDQISSLLIHLRSHFGLQLGAEVSLEVDPASFIKKDLEGYLQAGINRFSLGGQSFDNKVLKRLGRRHNSVHLVEACLWLNDFYRSGIIKSWNLDLIQGLPGTDLPYWEQQLSLAIEMNSPHLSIYDLLLEPGTVFSWKRSRGELILPTEDVSIEMFRCTSSKLQEEGFARYEISNYSLPGHTSRHNRVYWSGAGWWGFGQGATSSPWGERLTRPRTSNAYKGWIEEQESTGLDPSLEQKSAKRTSLDDQVMVGLRRREGIDLMQLARCWGWNQKQCNENLNKLKKIWQDSIDRGFLNHCGWRFKLTDPEGMEISNQILVQMLIWWDSLSDCAPDQPIP